MSDVVLNLDEAKALALGAFINANTSEVNARSTAMALIAAQADGQRGHGLTRVPSYTAQALSGKVNGQAVPDCVSVSPAALRIDAGLGFAYPALDLAIERLAPLAKEQGVAAASIFRSHHFGQAGAHVERLANEGLVALLFGNSPKAIAFWGGSEPMMGTNPIAFAAPAPDGPPLVIDLAVSVAARGKILAAQKNGDTIPEDWALDQEGRPTTDPDAALAGSMAPMAGAKGAALALMVEILAAALTGGSFGYEASSFFTADGAPPDMGQTLIAIDPGKLSGGAFLDRMGVLLTVLDAADGARRPGVTRLENRARSLKEGVSISADLYAEIKALAGDI